MLGGEFAVLQASMLDGLSLYPFALLYDGWCPAEVSIGWRHIVRKRQLIDALPYAASLAFCLFAFHGNNSLIRLIG